MSNRNTSALAAALALVSAAFAPDAPAQSEPAQDVKVVNTPRVIVNNAASKPIPVYDAHPADPGEPFLIMAGFNASANAGGVGGTLATVPADRRYAIEYVSATCFAEGSLQFLPLAIGIRNRPTPGFTSTQHHVAFAPVVVSGGNSFSAASAPVRFEAAAGEEIFAATNTSALTFKSCTVTISGRSYWQ